ncbi:MAG: SRPBCC family protein [Solirubrobacteraceae bacterium]
MTERSTDHATFTLERTYAASPARVFGAWADPQAKASWFGPPESRGEHSLEFGVGGRERLTVDTDDGARYTYDALYRDIVPDRRIVYVYEMYRDDTRLSVSVATVELEPVGEGTRLVLTEQGVFLDGQDTPAAREDGTKPLLVALESFLEGEVARG